MPNVPQQRLHEYLNNDLLNALDVSPSISKINSGIPENMQNLNDLGDNNPNNLYGFSLYPQTNNNKNVEIENYIQNQNMNNANNYNYQNNFNYNYPNNNTNNNAYYQNFNNNYTNLNYNINDPKVFIPTKLRNAEQNNKQNNNKKETLNNGKNKFDNGKKNKQKNKKFFEVREGDWRCSNCNNLNFSFRNKCNRCSLPKELSQPMDPMNPQAFNQNQQFQLMNGMNPNFMQGNVNNGSNVNYHA